MILIGRGLNQELSEQGSWFVLFRKFGDYSREGPLVPIPNTQVKLPSAEDTWLETAREIKTSPKQKRRVLLFSIYSSIAQSVEHAAVNRRVVGSSPTWGAIYGPLVKRLRHRPFTAVSRVRFSYGSPRYNLTTQ